ncbi:hypothetical protein [Lyngbya sp. CCY1209]|uniref:hypothetical protein n=1 Tax=Lyngbya sp. CCY1209 TaxID=2886103 RepID=UPI002D2025DC|nr:hypothetical protein [Lyngbya sp. CCY1209]MEB3882221.1 hypothetical protein [Lyngbya sp. CCY1209]
MTEDTNNSIQKGQDGWGCVVSLLVIIVVLLIVAFIVAGWLGLLLTFAAIAGLIFQIIRSNKGNKDLDNEEGKDTPKDDKNQTADVVEATLEDDEKQTTEVVKATSKDVAKGGIKEGVTNIFISSRGQVNVFVSSIGKKVNVFVKSDRTD